MARDSLLEGRALCWRRYTSAGPVAAGIPHWGRDTPQGLQPMGNPYQGGRGERSKEQWGKTSKD